MRSVIKMNDSVYNLCSAYPELKAIMAELGFADITKPGMLQSVGRIMTIPKGAAMRGIDMAVIRQKLEAHGFDIED